jgi:hypothetical protein
VALFTHSATASFLTRKDPSGTYEEPTRSSVKKAKKAAEGLERRRKKAAELERAKNEDREKRDKVLKQSKKIVQRHCPPQGDEGVLRLRMVVRVITQDIQAKIVHLEPSPISARSGAWMGAPPA